MSNNAITEQNLSNNAIKKQNLCQTMQEQSRIYVKQCKNKAESVSNNARTKQNLCLYDDSIGNFHSAYFDVKFSYKLQLTHDPCFIFGITH